MIFFNCGNKLFGGNVHAQIHDFQTISDHHHPDKVLADIVQVAFHRPKYHLASGFNALVDQQRFDDIHTAVHCPGCNQNLGHKHFIILKFHAYDAHSG